MRSSDSVPVTPLLQARSGGGPLAPGTAARLWCCVQSGPILAALEHCRPSFFLAWHCPAIVQAYAGGLCRVEAGGEEYSRPARLALLCCRKDDSEIGIGAFQRVKTLAGDESYHVLQLEGLPRYDRLGDSFSDELGHSFLDELGR